MKFEETSHPNVLEKESTPCPAVQYDEEVFDARCPYRVTLNTEQLGKIWSEMGISRERIEKTVIVIGREDPLDARSLGAYNPETDCLSLFMDRFTEMQTKLENQSTRILREGPLLSSAERDDFRKVLKTERFVPYLAELAKRSAEDRERGLMFAKKLIERGIIRKMTQTVAHESQHLRDEESEPPSQALTFATYIAQSKFFSVLAGLFAATGLEKTAAHHAVRQYIARVLDVPEPVVEVSLLTAEVVATSLILRIGGYAMYLGDPSEKRARVFEEQSREDEAWGSVLSLSHVV